MRGTPPESMALSSAAALSGSTERECPQTVGVNVRVISERTDSRRLDPGEVWSSSGSQRSCETGIVSRVPATTDETVT